MYFKNFGRVGIALFICTSCSLKKITHESEKLDAWSILENSISENWNDEKILQVLGKPSSKIDSYWIYDDAKGSQEWAVEVKDKQIVSILYIPSSRIDVSLPQIKSRWSRYNCKEVSYGPMISHKNWVSPFLSCDDGKRRVTYNFKGEVGSITISKEELPPLKN